MRDRAMRILAALLALPLLAQAPAVPVFTQFTPTSWGLTFGPDHCYAWNKLAPPYTLEIACYLSGLAPKVQATPTLGLNESMTGDFRNSAIKFTFIFHPSNSSPGKVDYDIVGTPVGAPEPPHNVGTF